jgi:hypothetical protein
MNLCAVWETDAEVTYLVLIWIWSVTFTVCPQLWSAVSFILFIAIPCSLSWHIHNMPQAYNLLYPLQFAVSLKIYCIPYSLLYPLQFAVSLTIYCIPYNLLYPLQLTVSHTICCIPYSLLYPLQFAVSLSLLYLLQFTVSLTVYSIPYNLLYPLRFAVSLPAAHPVVQFWTVHKCSCYGTCCTAGCGLPAS